MTNETDDERLYAGKLFKSHQLSAKNRSRRGRSLAQQINRLPLEQVEQIVAAERQLIEHSGQDMFIQPPLMVEYGHNITIGDHFYCNFDAIFLDKSTITIGDNVMVGPRVNFLTAGHPVDAKTRNEFYEYAKPIVVGNDVWIGGNVTILPGVTIGSDVVIGAGAVVTKDIPDHVIAVGNPARVLRTITPEEQQRWREEASEYEAEVGR